MTLMLKKICSLLILKNKNFSSRRFFAQCINFWNLTKKSIEIRCQKMKFTITISFLKIDIEHFVFSNDIDENALETFKKTMKSTKNKTLQQNYRCFLTKFNCAITKSISKTRWESRNKQMKTILNMNSMLNTNKKLFVSSN